MNAEPIPFPRTLAHVLLDIAMAQRLVKHADQRCSGAPEGSPDEEHWSNLAAGLDKRLTDLRDEARAMVESAIGVTWDQLMEANL